jgi:phosphate-selective porin OprO/OprP
MGIDMGYVDGRGDVKEAFSDLDGFDPDFRRLKVSAFVTLYNAIDFKFEIDFANVKTIKDVWIRYKKNRFLSHFRFGHIKEPFSLERLIATRSLTFMERALPTDALTPGRNIGIKYNSTAFNERVTFATGFFWNTGSLHEVANPQDSISDANGYNITARITGLAWYYDEGRRLLHLGLGYSRGTRDSGEDDAMRLSALPESYIADRTLVDTDEFFVDSNNYISTEMATVSGPLSFQSEITHCSGDSDERGDLDFWGYYLYVSYFLTGEHREYDTSKGIFSQVHPKQNLNLRERKWGAWEIGFRHSFVDLNDKSIEGGKERNFTLAINWYFKSNMRVMLNYIRADVEDRDNNRVVDDGSADIFQMRLQGHF